MTMYFKWTLTVIFIFFVAIERIYTSKLDLLKSILKASEFARDVNFDSTAVTCSPCAISISVETTNHFSNVLRHFYSDNHKSKARWYLKEDMDSTDQNQNYKLVSMQQKSTILSFFGKAEKPKTKSPSNNIVTISEPIRKDHAFEKESDSMMRELQLKENLLQQNTKMNVMKAKEITSAIQRNYTEIQKDEGGDQQPMKLYLETLASNIERHITYRSDNIFNSFETKHLILTKIQQLQHKDVTNTVDSIENFEKVHKSSIKFFENLLDDRMSKFVAILDRQKVLHDTFTADQLIQSLENTISKSQSIDSDVYIKFSLLLQQGNCISNFLSDILQNMDKRRPVWSESTVNLFSLLLNYGGPVAVNLIKANLGGPSLSRVYLQARQTTTIETSFNLTETSFKNAAEFYKNVCKGMNLESVIFTIAIDATPVLPLIRAKGNKLLGFASSKDIIVNSAEDIIQTFKDKSLQRAQQTYVFVLVPLRTDIPYYILAAQPVVKGENQNTVQTWLKNSKEWGKENKINIFGIGADGDSKIRSFYLNRYLKVHQNEGFTIDRNDFTFVLPTNHLNCLDCPFPDPRHLLKKWRNQLLNVRRLLIFGNHLIQLEHLMELADCENYKHSLGLWKTDIRVNDKQNVQAAIRLFNPNVQNHLSMAGEEKYRGTIVFLKLGNIMNELYFNKQLSIRERIRYAWTLVQFCLLWKSFIIISKYNKDKTFISDQTYNDVIIAGHSFILMTKLHFIHHKNQPFEPWTWGSDSCENVFSKSRCFIRTKNNFCYSEFLDICKRIQKVTETECNFCLKSNELTNVNFLEPISLANIDIVIEEEMMKGNCYAQELLDKTGMSSLLYKAGIIDRVGNIKSDVWNHEQQMYDCHSVDELDDLSQDEIASMSNEEILHTVVANDADLIHSADLLDMACEDGEQHGTEPTTLSSSDSSTGSRLDQSSTTVATVSTPSIAMDSSCSSTEDTTVEQENNSKKNTHIFYKGNWYHISQFVSWEQGKFYMPKQSRLTRFYANYAIFDKFIPFENQMNTDTILFRGDYIATWNFGKFSFGKLMRIVKPSAKGKCAHPQFNWKTSSEDINTDFAIQILESVHQQQDIVPDILKITKEFKWILSKEYVLKLDILVDGDNFIIESACRKLLIDAIPYLQENDKKEEQRKREDKKRKLDEKRAGPPEQMTIQILKTILNEKGVKYSSKDRKADLVKLVKEKIRPSIPSNGTSSVNQNTMYKAKQTRKRMNIIVEKKRTIFQTYCNIPVDMSKHYLHLIISYLIHILFTIFDVQINLLLIFLYTLVYLCVLWDNIIISHLKCLAIVNIWMYCSNTCTYKVMLHKTIL